MSIDTQQIVVSDIDVEVVRKPIKNLHLGVYPPDGRVRVATPLTMTQDAVRTAIIRRISWIRKQQAKFAAQARQSARDYVSGETHYFLGVPYRLRISQRSGKSQVRINGDRLELVVPNESNRAVRESTMHRWLRSELRKRAEPFAESWAAAMSVPVPKLGIRRMRTRWGSCSRGAKRVWINSELIKKPLECIDYLVCHEVAHLIEPSHAQPFIDLMDKHMPRWRVIRAELNQQPLGHENWDH